MVSSVVSTSSVVTTLTSASSDVGAAKDVRGEEQRLRVALQTARVRLQNAGQGEDRGDVETEVRDINSRLRRLQTSRTSEPVKPEETGNETGNGAPNGTAGIPATRADTNRGVTAGNTVDAAEPKAATRERPADPHEPGQFLDLTV